jgi:two-component system sensor histidine kinase/response regulator
MELSPQATEGIKILIVDDEPQNLQLVGEILRREGMRFIFAIDGEEALEAAKEQQPTLILLDVMMPGIDGLEACKQLKACERTEAIPVIFLTAATEVTDLVSAFAAGGVDYIKKPFIREELLARVRTHINLHVFQQQLNALYQQKTELLTTLAHDIKNPISAIQGLAPLMIEDIKNDSYSSDELCSMLKIMGESACGMTELVNDILNEEARLQGTVAPLIEAQTNTGAVISHLVQLNAIPAREKSIQLRHELEFEPMVHISRRILTEMFDNIISNAVKYSRNNSEITIRLRPLNSPETGFRFEVHDQASPIPEKTRDALFRKFKTGPKAPLGNSSSHGIGLAIVKRLVGLYEGQIGVYEREDIEGNVFYLEIPIQ